MPSEITKENTEGVPCLPSPNGNSTSEPEQSLLNDMRIDVDNIRVQETMEADKGNMENVNSKDPIGVSNDETNGSSTEKNINIVSDIKVSQGNSFCAEYITNQEATAREQNSESVKNIQCTDENLIDKVSDFVIPLNGTHNVESLINQNNAQDQLSESLRNIQKYNSDSSDSESEDSEEDSDSESSEDSSDSESSEDSSDSEDEEDVKMKEIGEKNKKIPEEESWLSVLGVDLVSTELPDISTLELNEREEFIHMGNLESVIDKIVTVAGLPGLPAYDLDTLLFLEVGRKVLGYVIDVMGPVTAPVYILQMSSVEAIKNLQLQKGTKVYCAPRSQYTKYVLIQELMKIRGSDASWVGDMEVPVEFQEYSDDEQERQSKAPKKENKRKRSQERHATPDTMDRLPQGGQSPQNINRTPVQNKHQNHKQQQGRTSRPFFRNNSQGIVQTSPNAQNWNVVNPVAVAARNVPLIPAFDPSVPPPTYGVPPFYSVQRPMFPPDRGLVPPSNFAPIGRDFNGGRNRPFFRQNMPGPSNGNWFNQ